MSTPAERSNHLNQDTLIYNHVSPLLCFSSVLPLVTDKFLYRSNQFLAGKFMDAEFLRGAAGHHAVYVVALVAEQRKHEHGHSVADTLVDAVASSVGHEHFSFGMS